MRKIKERIIRALSNLDDLEKFLNLKEDKSLERAKKELEFAVLEIGI
ncbi:MAG: hypothetical protein Athens101410_347 [Parcubacteria group bacterium Athens1014_10]|nr:MAG: hypothetical protein Athens101410_347 [Parcubacteria group bacterium Athens1014_10]TSD05163.1 MAG: hypothetical protein Athens071412_465 [Parcubacteria group bacterium Athens0714_12]